ncbi:MAG TPA: diadenylate cyclase CdaA [Candidatus Limnocylindrales bacterium]|nr:diadenylate cyclase CdaA [Candidatus Limnocylindrales bacterium]
MDTIIRDVTVFLASEPWWRHLLDLVDVSIVAFFLYRMFLLVRGTQAVQLLVGVLLLGLVGFAATLLNLRLLSFIFRNAAPAILIGIIVLFQPEIRRALDQFGRIGFIGRPLAHYNLQIFNRMIEDVIRATTKLAQRFTGALIVFEKETGLENYANTGIRINGELTAEFLEAIFFPNSPLHDGAVIIRGNQILAAGCVLPLADEANVRERMGTRHRAGLGLSMQTDAVVVILSEELGQIAVAHEGKLLRNLDPDRLRQVLSSLLQPRPEVHPPRLGWRR